MIKRTTESPIEKLPVAVEMIERRIFLIRGHKVMLDTDLAELYGVPTFRLNEAVKRNHKRFPLDFMFQLTPKETKSLISQIAMSKKGRGGRRTLAYAFTEQGVAMLSSVLNSERAILVNIAIMRAFVKLRELMATHTHHTISQNSKNILSKITRFNLSADVLTRAKLLYSLIFFFQDLSKYPRRYDLNAFVRFEPPGGAGLR